MQYTTGGLADGDTHTAVRHFEVRNGVAVVRWETGFRFTMVDISEMPFQDCTVDDPRSEVDPPFLSRDLLDPPPAAAP